MFLVSEMSPHIEMREIYKTFPISHTIALKGANLCVERGTIHALLGENGAGKTTLMKILCGLERMDSGKIFLKAKQVSIRNHRDALKYGIAMVHQNLNLIEDFTALENIILQKMPPKYLLFFDSTKAKQMINNVMEQNGIFVDLQKKAADLPVAERQKVEILRVLYLGAEILIFDEPTSYLNELESEQFFKVMKKLKESGKTIIFITHNAQDALAVSDKITILRNGVTVYSSKGSRPSLSELTLMMAGETEIVRKQFTGYGSKKVLQVENLVFKSERQIVGPISFEIKEGEILGLIGFNSSGAVELTEAIAGMRKTLNGKITFHGKDITEKDMAERRKLGVGYIPQKKTQVGLSTKLPVAENLIINKYKELSCLGWLKYKEIGEWSNKLIEEFEIKVFSPWQPVETLSGGNMQRVVIAREVRSMPRLLIACDPTSGLDLRSVNFVHKKFLKLCEEGSSILMYSSDLDEILKICDRILIMSKGKLVAQYEKDPSLTKNKLIEAILSNESRAELA